MCWLFGLRLSEVFQNSSFAQSLPLLSDLLKASLTSCLLAFSDQTRGVYLTNIHPWIIFFSNLSRLLGQGCQGLLQSLRSLDSLHHHDAVLVEPTFQQCVKQPVKMFQSSRWTFWWCSGAQCSGFHHLSLSWRLSHRNPLPMCCHWMMQTCDNVWNCETVGNNV